ncbi:MAG: alpha/beta fold hydrolase [Lautropia sp.]
MSAAHAPTLLLLHGLGASAAVWSALAAPMREAGYRCIAPDLPGHGAAPWLDTYDYATHADAIARGLESGTDLTGTDLVVVGHSMGAIVGMALAAAREDLRIRGVVAFSVKLDADPVFVERMRRVGAQPPRWHASRDDAAARFLAFAGLDRLEHVDGSLAASGVVEAVDAGVVRYRVATDPRVYLGVGGDVDALRARLAVPLRVLGGSADPMISIDDMRRIDPQAFLIDGLGHNPQVEAPLRLWAAIEPIIARWCAAPR